MLTEHYELVPQIANGYFYTFTYLAKKPQRFLDKTPFIYCIGPVENRENMFTAINLHHIELADRIKLIEAMQRSYCFMDAEIQHIISEQSLNALVPGILFGLRMYNMKNVFELKRVKNAAVPLYLHLQGDIYMGTPDDKVMKYLLHSGIYKDSTHFA